MQIGETQIGFGDIQGRTIDVTAGSIGTWRFIYTAGEGGIKEGGGLRIVREDHKFWLGLAKQRDDPQGYDFCSVETSGDCQVEIEALGDHYKSPYIATVRVVKGQLKEGQQITLRIGDDRRGGYPAVCKPSIHTDCRFRVELKTSGRGDYRILPERLSVSLVPGPAEKLTLVIPSRAQVGKGFPLKLRLEDKNSNPGAQYEGTILFDSHSDLDHLPEKIELGSEDIGVKVVNGIVPLRPGIIRVRASTADGSLETISNPCQVMADSHDGIFWGDLHCHTRYCDGTGTAEENYRFARDRAFLDVCALAEHVWAGADNVTYDEACMEGPVDGHLVWSEEQKQGKAFYESGKFVTLLGYEYTPYYQDRHRVGDHCVYFQDMDTPLINDADISALSAKLSEHDGLLIPHAHANTNWEYRNPGGAVRCLLEVASMHGRFEWFMQSGLQRGEHLGVIGNSDGHFGCPGYDNWGLHGRNLVNGRRQFSVQSSITAFCANNLTREAIWEAMKRRQVYATTGERIILRFEINGEPMGGEVVCQDAPHLSISAHGTAPIGILQIIRNDRLLYEILPGEMDVEVDFEDENPLQSESYYYVRVGQENGAYAWSSPIWVKYSGQTVSEDGNDLPLWNEGTPWPLPLAGSQNHTDELMAYLEENDSVSLFSDIHQIGIYKENRGRYSLFRAKLRNGSPVHIHFFLDFPDRRMCFYPGWAEYGPFKA